MKKIKLISVILLLSLIPFFSFTQNMNNERLETILNVVSDSIVGQNGSWKFKIKDHIFMCITDETHNRMRIISPIIEQNELTNEEILKSLEANFHTALDVKYALSNKILWSVFIHPLKELTDKQVKDAVSQVYYAALTYGITYSSTNLVFPGAKRNEISKPTEKVINIDLLQKKLR